MIMNRMHMLRTVIAAAVLCACFLAACEIKEDNPPMTKYALIEAAERGDVDELRKLIDRGADLNATDTRGRTAMMAATHANKPESVKILIEAGADVNKQDNRLDNPFLYAGAEGLLEILRLTIDAGADPTITNRYGGVAIIPASEHGYVQVVEELLTRTKINVNHVNNLGWTALLEAVILGTGSENHKRVVELLIKHGADVNLADSDGVTPLQHAKNRRYKDIAQILEAAGAK